MTRLISPRLVAHYVELHRAILAGIILLFVLTTLNDIITTLLVDDRVIYELGGFAVRTVFRIVVHAAAFALASAAIRRAFVSMTASCREITDHKKLQNAAAN